MELADFLDQFYLDRRAERIEDEPLLLAGRIAEGAVVDAYLAATALHLARQLGVAPPFWVRAQSRTLRVPWFASPGAEVRATLLVESPAAFRERNLFVSENALSRA
jgi:hypothetical protein